MRQIALVFALLVAACTVSTDPPGVVDVASPQAAPMIGDDIQTPFGRRHKSCVRDVGEDAVVEPNGAVMQANGLQVQIDCLDESIPEPTTSGWVISRSWSSPRWVKKMTATFKVPSTPDDQSKLVYLFPGLEPSSGSTILQPVLAFGYGGPFWSIASWACGSPCPHSTIKTVNAGDTIEGTMVASSCTSAGKCTWTITTKDVTTNVSTALTVTGQPAFYWTFGGVLEAYSIDSCAQYPRNASATFTSLHVYDHNLAELTPTWHEAQGNMTPTCGYTSSASTHTVTLAHFCRTSGDSTCTSNTQCCSGQCVSPCPYYGAASCCK
jgi:hypothetical protein